MRIRFAAARARANADMTTPQFWSSEAHALTAGSLKKYSKKSISPINDEIAIGTSRLKIAPSLHDGC
jgi:hypothetical protein